MGALLPFGRAVTLMGDQCGRAIGMRHSEWSPDGGTGSKTVALSVDGGHVKSVRSYQMRSFEILLANASNDRGQHRLFSSVAVEADRERLQLGVVLRDLGATASTPITVLTDGASRRPPWP